MNSYLTEDFLECFRQLRQDIKKNLSVKPIVGKVWPRSYINSNGKYGG